MASPKHEFQKMFPVKHFMTGKPKYYPPPRNRLENLGIFLKHMHPILIRQQLDYTIFIIEQAGDDDFNRAKLFNVGFLEAIKAYKFVIA